ncbi:MOSC domain-containing protein [Photobacterium damselae subsp. damselae]|uniref:MOSC domain-containing protein n=1 Tax=Photobacterium damselae TaxID=38293 RepID=UPI000A2FC4E9|nr:MOSC domain-containing protein [Photobacterium damselae]ARR51277.1 MOSC domain-containing protein [Photobacterium damselae subsp. damselae]QAY36942.1 MOSC domain-containing protein [Photobacterium damselae subsp. damselae]QOQ70494.1 MOSC domain-containing protein [Photobacterium damselae subsp. damselae]
MQKNNVIGVYCGSVSDMDGIETAMFKQSVSGRIYLSETGLEGDSCASTKHHGGTERALHQYPVEHYAFWQQQYGVDKEWCAPGMGENISSQGMTEENVCIGDRYQWGEAIIEVSQPRSPCYKLNTRWNVAEFSVQMQKLSRCGWLYRVVKPGPVSVSEPLILLSRPENALTIKQVCDIYFGDPLNRLGLEALQQQTALSHNWQTTITRRLESNELENWNFRLLGHA